MMNFWIFPVTVIGNSSNSPYVCRELGELFELT
jgi:hypothetical protein